MICIFSCKLGQGNFCLFRGVFLLKNSLEILQFSRDQEETGPLKQSTISPLHSRFLLAVAGLRGTNFELFCFLSLIRRLTPQGPRMAPALFKSSLNLSLLFVKR